MKAYRKDLDKVIGGSDITSSMVNSFVNVIKLLIDAGKGVGSSIRRVTEGEMCPLQ